ncbi:MAG: anti-anti-sigma factor [Lentisphaeria bacterium]|jgi:anti-anti-sigma factor
MLNSATNSIELTLVDVKREEALVMITISGPLDVNGSCSLERSIEKDFDENGIVSPLVIDLTDVSFISSRGVQALLDVFKKSTNKNMVALSGASNTVLELLNLVGFASLVKVFDTTNMAREELLKKPTEKVEEAIPLLPRPLLFS